MYESFFQLREKPFSLLPDPEYLYLGRQHSNAFTMLEYGLTSQAGFTVISGEIGSGKTTLIRHLLNHQDPEVTVGLVTNTHKAISSLLQWVLFAYSLDYKGKDEIECYEALVEFLVEEYGHNRRAVLIVDEAQNMEPGTLEELRLLSNVNADKDQIIQLVLVGQPELRETLKRPELVQFAQRITVDYHLGSLDPEDTLQYILHRLQVAGGSPDLISQEACHIAHRASRGIPRLINTLCDNALVYAYGANQRQVTRKLMLEVVRDKFQGGLFGGATLTRRGPRQGDSNKSGNGQDDLATDLEQLQQDVERLTRHLNGTGSPRR